MLFLVVLLWSVCIGTFGKPVLTVHIGPSKTASTTIQNSISQNIKKVKAAGWLPLGSENGGGVIHGRVEVDRAFLDFNEKKDGNFFQTALDSNQNVIVSCEYLGSAEALSMDLYDQVLEAFDTTVVMFYRDFLSIQISLHYQRRSLESLTDFLTNPTELKSSPVVIGAGGYFERMEAWNRFEKMIVLDFNGMVAKGVSFQYAFFCDILHIQEICDDEEYKVNHISNPTTDTRIEDVRKSRVADLFHSFAFSRGCKCDLEAFKKDVDLSVVPIHTQDFSHLVLYSKLLDQEFRRRFEVTMYSDPEATTRAIEGHLDYEDIDTQRILLDEAWHRKFEDALKFQVSSGSAKCDIHSKHKQGPVHAAGAARVDRLLRGE